MNRSLEKLSSPSIHPTLLQKTVQAALREDAASRDLTTLAIVPASLQARAILLAKEELVVCGMPLARAAFLALDPRLKIKVHFNEGEKIAAGSTIAELSGRARALLSSERVALNFLQHLSGIATLTSRFQSQLRGTRAKILDTRKTLPGLRLFERYAVKTGGGTNHRYNLESAILIKDNHLEIAGSVTEALRRLPKSARRKLVIVEVKDLREFQEALRAGVGHVLLDNMSLQDMRKAVRLKEGLATKDKPKLEASGGVTLERARAIGKTGVDYISAGSLTHSARAVDISLEIIS